MDNNKRATRQDLIDMAHGLPQRAQYVTTPDGRQEVIMRVDTAAVRLPLEVYNSIMSNVL